MSARHRQCEIVDIGGPASRPLADQDGELCHPARHSDVEEPDVRLRVLAVCQHAPILDPADQLLHCRVIEAHDRESVEWQILNQRHKCILDRVESLEVVEVLRVDVGHDGDVGWQLQERAVAFVGLDDHPIAGPEPRVCAIGVDDAAIDDGRVETGRVEQRRHQRGRRRLTMGAATATQRLRRMSSASISARRTTGIRLTRAATSSELSRLMAVDTTTTAALPRLAGSCPTNTLAPSSRRRFTLALSLASEPWTEWPRLIRTSAMPDIPMPPMPTKWIGPISFGSFMSKCLPRRSPFRPIPEPQEIGQLPAFVKRSLRINLKPALRVLLVVAETIEGKGAPQPPAQPHVAKTAGALQTIWSSRTAQLVLLFPPRDPQGQGAGPRPSCASSSPSCATVSCHTRRRRPHRAHQTTVNVRLAVLANRRVQIDRRES